MTLDNKTIFELGSYLNDRIGPFNTCNHQLSVTTHWLEKNRPEADADLAWLEKQGITCDCQVVIQLYIPMLFGMVKARPSSSASPIA
jgi:hypothetical protein